MKYPERLYTRVSAEQKEQIQNSADTAGMTICEYLRERALSRHVKSTVDVRMLAELRRIGGMVKSLWKEGRTEEATAIREGLDGLRMAIQSAQEAERDR